MILKTHPNYKNLIGAIFKQESESEWTNQHYLRRKRGGATVIFSTELTEEKKLISKPRRPISNVVTHHLVVARLLFDCYTHCITSANPNPGGAPPAGREYFSEVQQHHSSQPERRELLLRCPETSPSSRTNDCERVQNFLARRRRGRPPRGHHVCDSFVQLERLQPP